ncbi:MAG: hypothetical protein GY870_16680, partial [archaeon]|nr:hypothetical protein [archaeon]
ILKNVDGFGKIILANEKRTPFFIFLFALTPLPDDLIFIPLGMIKYPAWKCIIPGWLGKIFITTLYCLTPVFMSLGLNISLASDDFSSVITEAIMLLVTITVMFFIMSFDWNKLMENRKKNKSE